MSESTIWWVMTGILVALEMLTGTFYLLVVALGFAGGAIAAHMALPVSAQIAVSALIGVGGSVALHLWRRRKPGDPPARAQRSVNLDIGETVTIDAWAADRTAQVRYRGSQWTVVLRGDAAPVPGVHRVVELSGNRLIVEPS